MLLCCFRSPLQFRDPRLDVFEFYRLSSVAEDRLRGPHFRGWWRVWIDHNLAQRRNRCARHLVQSGDRLAEGSTARLTVALLELGLLYPSEECVRRDSNRLCGFFDIALC